MDDSGKLFRKFLVTYSPLEAERAALWSIRPLIMSETFSSFLTLCWWNFEMPWKKHSSDLAHLVDENVHGVSAKSFLCVLLFET